MDESPEKLYFSNKLAIGKCADSEGALLEFIEGDLRVCNAEVTEHLLACLHHLRRTAEVEFDRFGMRVVFQVMLEYHLMDESGATLPPVFIER